MPELHLVGGSPVGTGYVTGYTGTIRRKGESNVSIAPLERSNLSAEVCDLSLISLDEPVEKGCSYCQAETARKGNDKLENLRMVLLRFETRDHH
jgi:hypothetical protein